MGYQNHWIEVWEDEVTRPDGSPGVYGLVHFLSRAVGVVAIDDEDRVVLVGQHRYALDEWSWEIPEGGVPYDEELLDGARRELEEETGYRAAAWRELGRAHLSNSVSDELGIMYVATGLIPGQARPEATEQIEMRLVPFGEALSMTLDGRITDAMSVIAIGRVALERATVGR
jgi:8-oxo-dGTP pyrophosphatase MutT (NUDIX family)